MKFEKVKIFVPLLLITFILLQLGMFLPVVNAEEEGIYKPVEDVSEKELEKEINNSIKIDDWNDTKKIEKGKKGFYKAYEKEINKMIRDYEKIHGKHSASKYKERIEKLDYHKGEFACETGLGAITDISCHLDSLFLKIGKGTLEYVLAPLSRLAIKPSEIMGNEVINKYKKALNSLPEVLLALFLMIQVAKQYAFRFMDGEGGKIFNEKIIKTMGAAFLVFMYTPFFKIIMNLQFALTQPIYAKLAGSEKLSKDLIVAFLLTPNDTMMIFFILIFALLFLVMFFQMVYTFALIAVLYILGPLAIVTMVNEEYNLFNLWLRTIVARILTLFIQGLTVVLSFGFLTDFGKVMSMQWQPFQFAVAIGFLIVGMTTPMLLQQFGNSSGSGRIVIAGFRTISRRPIRR